MVGKYSLHHTHDWDLPGVDNSLHTRVTRTPGLYYVVDAHPDIPDQGEP
jgi:hypothetical protein